MTSRLVFVDTEFTSLDRGTAELISIALVDWDGPELYLENADWDERTLSDFARDTVVPLLGPKDSRLPFAQIGARLSAWCEGLPGTLVLTADSKSWDWFWIGQLFAINAWPSNVYRDEQLYLNWWKLPPDLTDLAHGAMYRRWHTHEGIENREHHALGDARSQRDACLTVFGSDHGGDPDYVRRALYPADKTSTPDP
jgi:hypothetical protein